VPVLLVTALAVSASGCAMDVDTFAMPEIKKPTWSFTQPDWNMSANKVETYERPIAQQDLIGADGRCAGEAPAAPAQALNFTAGPEAGRPGRPAPGLPPAPETAQPAARGVGLGMSECEVVHALGHTDRIEVANESGQRNVVLTYLQGPRPGVYRFARGRLVTIERGAEAPAPAKPEKKTARKPARKPTNS
jgi:hypothetical protein